MGDEAFKVHIHACVDSRAYSVCLATNALTNEAKIAVLANIVACAKALAFVLNLPEQASKINSCPTRRHVLGRSCSFLVPGGKHRELGTERY